jgi:hypothetical protein
LTKAFIALEIPLRKSHHISRKKIKISLDMPPVKKIKKINQNSLASNQNPVRFISSKANKPKTVCVRGNQPI